MSGASSRVIGQSVRIEAVPGGRRSGTKTANSMTLPSDGNRQQQRQRDLRRLPCQMILLGAYSRGSLQSCERPVFSAPLIGSGSSAGASASTSLPCDRRGNGAFIVHSFGSNIAQIVLAPCAKIGFGLFSPWSSVCLHHLPMLNMTRNHPRNRA